jgi:hypothetical protein
MQFKLVQKHIITGYRLLMTGGLLLIVAGVLSYLFLMAFYAVDRNWAAPLVLSPTQEKVLAYQPQVAAMEAALLKDRVDLATAEQKYAAITAQTETVKRLIGEFDSAAAHESRHLAATASSIGTLLQQKHRDDQETEQVLGDVRPLLASIRTELSAGLITKSEAASRRLTIQASLNALTDSRAGEVALAEQGQGAHDASSTLGNGGALSLQALQSVASKVQLQMLLSQAEVDAESARDAIEQLRATMASAQRVLDVARQSPYYVALTQRVPVAFVPYDNLASAKEGSAVYDCYLQILFCHRVGKISRVYDAEEYARTPLFKTDIKGRLVGVLFEDVAASESALLFIGHKPLLL